MSIDISLTKKMIRLANEKRLPQDHPLRVAAADYIMKANASPQNELLTATARERAIQAWEDYTGESGSN